MLQIHRQGSGVFEIVWWFDQVVTKPVRTKSFLTVMRYINTANHSRLPVEYTEVKNTVRVRRV